VGKDNSKGYRRSYEAMIIDEMKEDKRIKQDGNKRRRKKALYRAFTDYILCLENSLIYEDNLYNKFLLIIEIKKLKKEQKKYYEPSLLEGADYGLMSEGALNSREKYIKEATVNVLKKRKN